MCILNERTSKQTTEMVVVTITQCKNRNRHAASLLFSTLHYSVANELCVRATHTIIIWKINTYVNRDTHYFVNEFIIWRTHINTQTLCMSSLISSFVRTFSRKLSMFYCTLSRCALNLTVYFFHRSHHSLCLISRLMSSTC